MIEFSILVFVIIHFILCCLNKKQIIVKTNNEKSKLIDIINSDIDDDNINDNIIKLISYYNYEGHILLTRVKNDLIRDKQYKLNKLLLNRIKYSMDKELIKLEIKNINYKMSIYKNKLNTIFIKLKQDLHINIISIKNKN